MPDGSGWEFSRTTDQNFYGIPAVALGMWCPWLVGAAKWNAQVQEGFGTVASEWQNFVSRRLKEDFAFMQRVAQCRTPNQMWAAHADFWQKAMEDYGKEYMLMSKLAAGVTHKAAAAAQCATQEASRDAFPSMLGGDGVRPKYVYSCSLSTT